MKNTRSRGPLGASFTRSIGGALLALSLSLMASASTGAKDRNQPGDGAPFTAIYAFGDSLSDVGNLFAIAGFPGAPYFEGRFSDGPVWIEYLAEELGVSPGAVFSYAFGGATSGRENNLDIPGVAEFPGLHDELDLFEADLAGKAADPRALYIVWVGANDFFVSTEGPEATIANAIGNTLSAIGRLHQAGARRIMVANLPDLGLTPLGAMRGAAELSFLTAFYNYHLDNALDYLAANGIDTTRVDAAGLIQDIVAAPADYGLTNATVPFLAGGGDASDFLFWDTLHPTSAGHSLIAMEAMRVLRSDYRHAWATPRKRQN